MRLTRRSAVQLALASLFSASCKHEEPAGRGLRIATPTNLKETGLADELLAAFEKKAGYRGQVSAVGSGNALRMLAEGAADVAITHALRAEMAAAHAGAIGARTPFMHNHLVIAGPRDRLEVVAGAADTREVLRRIAASGAKFISRGDHSGTHEREVALWQEAGVLDLGTFVINAKAGMAPTLARAAREEAFTLCDRATFIAKRDPKLVIVFQGDEALRSTYSVIEPKPGPCSDAAGARALAEFVVTREARALIGAFGVKAYGEPLFIPERGAVPLSSRESAP